MRFIFLICIAFTSLAQDVAGIDHTTEEKRWLAQAVRVKIVRDNWGIAHIYGKSDADAVFGMLYAQCEDDFKRVERNYLTATGRLAEAFGEQFIYHDLRTRLFQDSIMALDAYKKSPEWLKKLCNAFADGINYYLYTHPNQKVNVIKRYEPWMPFLFSEGSIGGDIETVSLQKLKEFYGDKEVNIGMNFSYEQDDEPRGSNGFAIAPSRSASGNALFLINPHTTFYFRSEIHVNSEEGLGAYGAVTWGQFFIYQGFNKACGWMHTSSEADAIDQYLETVGLKNGKFYFNYGNVVKEGTVYPITVKYKTPDGIQSKTFTTYYTQHGPIIGKQGDKWMSIRIMREPMKALTQSFIRTKSKNFSDFEKSMKIRTNSSNNTVYADADGNIAYWHGNFIPKRNTKFDWNKPVDGTNPETEWKGLHDLDEIVSIRNPATGWIQNCNSTPFTASGSASPKKEKYPAYMAPDGENTRGQHAIMVLENANEMTMDKLIDKAFDSYLTAFPKMILALNKAYENCTDDSIKLKLEEPMKLLSKWNCRYSLTSVETSLAIYWATNLRRVVSDRLPEFDEQIELFDFLAKKTYEEEQLKALVMAMDELTQNFGSWNTPWGEINRFQRQHGEIEVSFDDAQPSIGVPFTSSIWGSLASFGARPYPNTKKWYGNSGNSFVAVVEFGRRLKAKSVVSGGASSDPESPNFTNQAQLYADGKFKDVLFYYEDVMKNAERTYAPGQ